MDPANVKFCCSGECGINGIGAAGTTPKHWSFFTGPVSVATSPGGRGTRCYRFQPVAGQAQIANTFATAIAAPATVTARFYIWFTTLLTGMGGFDTSLGPVNGQGLTYKESDGKFYAYDSQTPAVSSSGITATTGRWYCIDVKIVLGTTRTVDISIDGTPLPQISTAGQSAQSLSQASYGNGINCSGDYYIRDMVVSVSGADYPIGPGQGYALFPNADRTNSAANPTDGNFGHYYSATGDFSKGAGGGTALGAQNVEATSWQSLAKPLSITAGSNFVSDLLGANTERLVWELEDLPVGVTSINGVMFVVATHSASTTGNNCTFKVRGPNGNSTTAGTIQSLTPTTTVAITVSPVPQGVDSGGSTVAWTPTVVNGSNVMFGESSDVNPDPYCDGMCLEVDCVSAVISGPPSLKRGRVQRNQAMATRGRF